MTFGLHVHRHPQRALVPGFLWHLLVTALWALALIVALLYAGVRVLR